MLLAFVCLAGVFASAQQLAMEPLKDSGSNIYPAYEGWYKNDDGSFTLLVGYFNRNKKEVLDIPIGPENKIEPGGPDQGQPTHFEVGRGWGTIAIKVPKDFGDKKLVWTLTANGKTVSVPFGIVKGYQIEPYLDAAMGNKPPVIKFTETGGTIAISFIDRDDTVSVVVRDTGLGIPSDRLASVFEPFVQLERRLTSNHEGTGLGLAISRDLARGLGGELSARSTLGEGSEFDLNLKKVPAPAEEPVGA